MERIEMPATRSNLIGLKDELAFARESLDLLDQKKEILIRQVTSLTARADRVRLEVNRRLAEAYAQLKEAMVELGESAVESAGLGLKAEEQLSIRERSLMGVVLPQVSIDLPSFRPGYGLYSTGKTIDATAAAIHRAMEMAGELAEVEVSIERLMAELKKTLKRINALAHIYVPSYRTTVKAMEITLEEKEREALFQLKRIKDRSRLKMG
ncbi:MAG: V-type ATP synthase subunit D [Deltaproteobacteria bacterium]|nr:V-type ATP synthase subunit D [Deltaproteobacteria bacterium]